MTLEIDLSKDRGPRSANRGRSKVSGEDMNSVRLELVVSLDHEQDELSFDFDVFKADRFAVAALSDTAPGSLLRVVVGQRTMATPDAVQMLQWLRGRGVHVCVMASTIEAGNTWAAAIEGRPAPERPRHHFGQWSA